MLVKVDRLFEAHLTVADLGRSLAFYRDRLGLDVAAEFSSRRVAFLWLGSPGHTMLGLWEVGTAPMGMRSHVAFACSEEEVVAAVGRLRTAGIEPLDFDLQPCLEPVVLGWMPAAAVYFRDPDGNLLEYLAMLDGPAAPEAGVVGYREWAARRKS